jgi:hypothetical protein
MVSPDAGLADAEMADTVWAAAGWSALDEIAGISRVAGCSRIAGIHSAVHSFADSGDTGLGEHLNSVWDTVVRYGQIPGTGGIASIRHLRCRALGPPDCSNPSDRHSR